MKSNTTQATTQATMQATTQAESAYPKDGIQKLTLSIVTYLVILAV
jgi:hypothetical protein